MNDIQHSISETGDIQRAMKDAKHVDIARILDEVCDSIMTMKQNPNMPIRYWEMAIS